MTNDLDRKFRTRRLTRPGSSLTPAFVVKAIAVIVVCLVRNRHQAEGISASPKPFFEEDENGKLLPPIFIRGDENYHWQEDEHGYTIIDDPNHHGSRNRPRKVYAERDPTSGALVSTGVTFDSSDARTRIRATESIEKHIKPLAKIQKAACGHFCEDNPNRNHVRRGSSNERGTDRRNLRELANRRKLMSSTNTLRNLVVLIRFSDHKDRLLPNATDFGVLMNGPGGEGTSAPTGSVNDVFLSNSYGAFSLESTVYPWITVSKTEEYYADYRSGMGPRLFEAIQESLDVIDADPNVVLSEFNTDFNRGDPFIDAITVIHSGYGAEFGGYDCDGAATHSRIWSHHWSMYTGAWTSEDATVTVSKYHINPGLWGVCGSEISRIGVIAHETAHFLGLPDLYDPTGGSGIGIYCLMSDSWGVDGTQLYPPMLSPWSKITLGWLEPTILREKGDFDLRQSWQYPDVYKIELASVSDYLLIENRQAGSFDRLLSLGGLAIWHVDESMSLYGNSREGYPGQSSWPANSNHYHVSLLQADGRYDLERGDNHGDWSDLYRSDYYFGVDYLFPSHSDPMVGPFPNTDSYSRQGVVTRTNHFISDISASGDLMTFSFLPASPCQPNEIHFELSVLTDGKGYEVSWTLAETYTDAEALSGNGYSNYAHHNIEQCLPAKCYTFVINDAGNDGLCCGFGYGGYSVRLNGLKVASGNTYESLDEIDLKCMIPPTSSPTPAPFKLTTHTTHPSDEPSPVPSSPPSPNSPLAAGACGREESLFEITTEGTELSDEMSWNVQDMFGNIVISNDGQNADGGFRYTRECIPRVSCYTFSIHNSLDELIEGGSRGFYTVKFDGEVLASGHNFSRDQTIMFGVFCLQNGDIACTKPNEAISLSMFRLELVGDNGGDIAWSLVDGSKQVVRSSGPFGNCNANTLAVCLPREDCYEFIITYEPGDDTCCSSDQGQYTVMFSHIDDIMIQNFTGPVLDTHQVFLGKCYDMNFD